MTKDFCGGTLLRYIHGQGLFQGGQGVLLPPPPWIDMPPLVIGFPVFGMLLPPLDLDLLAPP